MSRSKITENGTKRASKSLQHNSALHLQHYLRYCTQGKLAPLTTVPEVTEARELAHRHSAVPNSMLMGLAMLTARTCTPSHALRGISLLGLQVDRGTGCREPPMYVTSSQCFPQLNHLIFASLRPA